MSKAPKKTTPAHFAENKALADKPEVNESPVKPEPRTLPKVIIHEDKTVEILAKSPEQVTSLFGSKSLPFATAIMHQTLNVSGTTGVLMQDGKDALAIVAALEPNDAVEALLTTQMAAVHIATMRHSQRMATADTVQQLDIQERTFNKLARTFSAQTEALRKHRNGGQQKMVVEHVTVNDGGQAIVGNVTKGG